MENQHITILAFEFQTIYEVSHSSQIHEIRNCFRDSNRSNESFDPATQVPRVQLEEELAVERKQVGELHSQMTCLGEELEQHKQQKQALEETVNNTQASLK